MKARITFFATIIGAAGCFAGMGMAASPGSFDSPDDQALILPEYDRLHIETPVAADLAMMNVRVFGPDNEELLSVRTKDQSVEFLVDAGLPDGEYRYETVSLFGNVDLTDRERYVPGETTMVRKFGTFTVANGQIVEKAAARSQEGASLLDKVIGQSMHLAGVVLDVIVPSAHATDLTIQGTSPSLDFDDTDDEDCTALSDWEIYTQGGSSDTDHNNMFSILGWTESCDPYGWAIPIVTLHNDGTDTASSSADSIVIDDDGDIHWAQSGMNWDKGEENLSIGTTDARSEIFISAAAPEITMHDEGIPLFSDEMGTSYDGYDYRIFFEDELLGRRNIAEFNWSAPSHSLSVDGSGNVGFGTSAPAEAVDVSRSAAAARFQLTSYTNTGNQAAQFIQRRAHGTSAAPTAVVGGDNIGLFSFRGYNGSNMTGSKAAISVLAAQGWTPSATGTRMLFRTTPNGSTTLTTVMEITQDGKVKVNGTALNVPDYVFEDDYQLMPLDELADFVAEHKHLPGVVAAEEVNAQGLDLAGSELSVLEKVEELALYTLQQHAQLTRQNVQLARLQAENLALQEKVARVDQLEQRVNLLIQGQENGHLMTATN